MASALSLRQEAEFGCFIRVKGEKEVELMTTILIGVELLFSILIFFYSSFMLFCEFIDFSITRTHYIVKFIAIVLNVLGFLIRG